MEYYVHCEATLDLQILKWEVKKINLVLEED